jgi:micrococcal nuclease
LQLALTSSSLAEIITGKVIGVHDGDTIEVLHNQHPERICLNGIDCPEKRRVYGKHAASSLAFGKLPIDCSVEEAMA